MANGSGRKAGIAMSAILLLDRRCLLGRHGICFLAWTARSNQNCFTIWAGSGNLSRILRKDTLAMFNGRYALFSRFVPGGMHNTESGNGVWRQRKLPGHIQGYGVAGVMHDITME